MRKTHNRAYESAVSRLWRRDYAAIVRRLPRSERDLRLFTACLLWLMAIVTLEFGSLFPSLAPDHVNLWRFGLGIPATAFAFFHVTIIKRMSDRAQQRWLLVSATVAAVINGSLMQVSPATWAIEMHVMGTMIWSAFFLRGRAVMIDLLVTTTVAISPVISPVAHFGAADTARLVVLVPAIWALTAALYIQKRTIDAEQLNADILAYQDPLTGLANQRALDKYVDVLAGGPAARPFGLLIIDLDGFKSANAPYGHLGGDHVLRSIALLLRRATAGRHLVARIGGDQFVVVMPGATDRQVAESDLFYRGVVIGADSVHGLAGVHLDASIGAAMFPRHGRTLSDLLTAAERSMFGEKTHRPPPQNVTDVAAGEPPPWLTEAVEGPPPRPGSRLRRTWMSRPIFARTISVYWIVSAFVMLAGFAVPGTEVRDPGVFLVSCALAIALGALLFIAGPQSRGTLHRLADAAALAGLAGVVYLTGGANSSTIPLVPVFVVYQAWFWSVRSAWWRLLGAWLVILSPLLYDDVFTRAGWQRPAAFLCLSSALTGALVFVLAISMTVRIDARRRSRQLALTDPLTGMPNRRAFAERVETELAAAGAGEPRMAVVILDLDDFKRVNKQLGRRVGDTLLKDVAAAVARAARADDLVARTGGDEFAAVLPAAGELEAAQFAQSLVEAAIAACGPLLQGAGIHVTASAGFALCPAHESTLDSLMRHADAAMMSVKRDGYAGHDVDGVVAGS